MKRWPTLFTSGVILFSMTALISARQETAPQQTAPQQTEPQQAAPEPTTPPPASQPESGQPKAGDEVVLPAGDGRDLVSTTCSQCHAIGLVTQHHEAEADWKKYVDDMIARGAHLVPAEETTVVAYLTKNFGPLPTTTASAAAKTESAPSTEEGKALVETKCSTCHDASRVSRSFRDKWGWTDVINSMVSRGAVLTPDEIEKILAYLVAEYGI